MRYFLAVLVVSVSTPYSQADDKGNLLGTIGEWGIFREVDSFTDKVACAATYYDREKDRFSQPFLRLNHDKSSYSVFFMLNYHV